ncbi:MAG: sporulation transcriptional regulator SpoIIID [Acutalibacteraceae bacterium]
MQFNYWTAIHKDVSERLKYINPNLYREVKSVLELNKSQRHIRGGLATKNKYLERKVNVYDK